MQFLSTKKYSTVIRDALPSMICVAAMLLSLSQAQADNYQDAAKLFKQGEVGAALAKVEAHLVAKPNDAPARFLKGVILSEQQKSAEAIRIFTALTEDHPELPEPYNNLAVLYANQSQYDKARNALEMAIRTHPSYAVAHENLGDIYATMASQAYDKALKLDSANTAIKAKLSLIKEIFTPLPATKAPAKIETSSLGAARKETEPVKENTAKKAVLNAKETTTLKVSAEDEVLEALRSWAKAWSSQDVKNYLAYYAADFKTPAGEARAQWEAARRERISRPKKIEVGISMPRVIVDAAGQRATVSFRQSYLSDTLKSSGAKTLSLVKNDNRWLIVEERVGN